MRFFAKGSPLDYPGDNQASFSLSIDDKTFNFKAFRESEDFRGPERHVITCGGFPTEQEAWEAGGRCKDTLFMLGVKMRRSLDLGKDKVTSPSNDAHKKMMSDALSEQGSEVQYYDNVYGLAVYPETPSPVFDEVYGYLTTEGPPRLTFIDVFEENYRLNWIMNERESLACALYGAAQTEVSARAKFFFLVSVVESLLESEERDPQAVEHVEHLIELTKESALGQSAKSSLLGTLKWLRYESINHMCNTLITRYLAGNEYGGKKAQQFFRECYSIRSDLLHTGKSSGEGITMETVIDDLNILVQDLLDSALQKSPVNRA